MKIHEEHKFQLVHIIRIDEMRTDHSFGHRVPIQLYTKTIVYEVYETVIRSCPCTIIISQSLYENLFFYHQNGIYCIQICNIIKYD